MHVASPKRRSTTHFSRRPPPDEPHPNGLPYGTALDSIVLADELGVQPIWFQADHTYNGMAVPLMLEIFDGTDWHASTNNTYTPTSGSAEAVCNGDWRVHMFMAVIGWNSTRDEALFQLRMGGGHRVNFTANATIQVAKVVVAPVGHASP